MESEAGKSKQDTTTTRVLAAMGAIGAVIVIAAAGLLWPRQSIVAFDPAEADWSAQAQQDPVAIRAPLCLTVHQAWQLPRVQFYCWDSVVPDSQGQAQNIAVLDAVEIFDHNGTLQRRISFLAPDSQAPASEQEAALWKRRYDEAINWKRNNRQRATRGVITVRNLEFGFLAVFIF